MITPLQPLLTAGPGWAELAERVGERALFAHPDDEDAAKELIDEIIVGDHFEGDTARKLAWCHYMIGKRRADGDEPT